MEYRSSAATVSRNGFAGKCAYDGVFAAPTRSAVAKLSSAVEDYREVFGGGDGGSSGSSIPLLDVPELRERKISVDVRSLKLDYADIFGGLGDSDYAVSFEDLIAEPRNGPEVARTPEYNRSSPEVSNPSNQVSTNEVPSQSFGEVKQFNVMYHKNSVASKNGTTGTKHIAQLHAVPGYTRLIDESSSLRKGQDDRPVTPAGSDTCSKMHCVEGTIEGQCFQKSMSDLPPNGTDKQTAQDSVKIQRKSMQSKSFSNDLSSDGNYFGLGTYSQQVQPPSNAVNNNEQESKGPVASNFESSTFDVTDAGASSPPYFGEEVDKNSVAATSAAAVKLAIENAQSRIRLAKELQERKKEGLENHEGLRAQKKRREKVAVKANILEEEKKVQKVLNTSIELSDWVNKRDGVKVGQVTPCCGDMKDLLTSKEAAEGMRRKEIKTVQAEGLLGERKEREPGEQFCELVRTVQHSAMALEVKQTDEVTENISSANGSVQEEIGMVNSTHKKPVDNNMKCKVVEEVHEWEDRVKKLYTCEGEHELEAHVAMLMPAQINYDQEGEKKLEVVQEHEGTEKEVRAPHEQDECYENQKETTESVGVLENVEAQEWENRSLMIPEEGHERVENGKKLGEAEEQEECTNGSANNHKMVTKVRKLEDIHGKEDNGNKLDESRGSEENEMEPEEPCKWKENENQQKDAESEENMEKSGDGIHKQEMIGNVFNNFKEREESEEYFEDRKSEETEQLEGEENEKELHETCQVEEDKMGKEETCEMGQEEACEWADTADIWTKIDHREKEEETAEAAHEALKYNVNNLEATDDMFRHNKNEHLSKTKETCTLKEIGKDVEATSVATLFEGERIIEGATSFEAINSEKGSESSSEGATDLDYKELFDINGVPDGALELDEMIKQMKEESDAFLFNATRVDLGKAEIKSGKKQIDQYAEESVIISNVEKHCNGLVHEVGEKSKSIKEAELSIGNEADRYNFKETCEERWVHNREAEAAQQPSTSGGRVETRKKESDQSSEKIRENHYETLITEEREIKYTEQRKRGVEREYIKKLDEAKEWEKEREKERIAVQRAIREARERAFAGARERATMEKLTAGARRKPVTEAREKLGKASAEANFQSSADKEAKLKAERAAVERATAEARERALEKAKSGKAASDARNQSEKLSGGSRDFGMGQAFPSSETQNRAPGPPNSCRYSNHGVPKSTERSEGANNEMAQRFKGERERQQRTAERAAKALAEKNTRDLLAQKEQAERNRLAEALDADIKRWSSRKEGNLRALLSTLHYILGPDSGWQAVPLTDIIATAAVKKMYKRATLYVHPDKLQQRGATIQHKYMCEKVFDILKEAWEKFNREER